MILGGITCQENIKDRYKLGKTLGKGAFARVRLATKIDDSEEEYAVKMIKLKALNMDDMIAVGQEIEILAQIDHPNVVKLYEIYQDNKYIYMVMEMMKGGE